MTKLNLQGERIVSTELAALRRSVFDGTGKLPTRKPVAWKLGVGRASVVGNCECRYAVAMCDDRSSDAGIMRKRWNGTWHWYFARKFRNFL